MQIIVIIVVVILILFYLSCNASEKYDNIGKPIDYPYYSRYNWYTGFPIGSYPWYNSITPLPFNNPTRFYGPNYLYPAIQDYYYPGVSFY